MSELRHQRTVIVPAGSVQLLGPNRLRRRLVITAPKLLRVWISFIGPAAPGQGMPLNPGTAALVLGHDDIGAAIMEEINAATEGGTETLGVLEVFA